MKVNNRQLLVLSNDVPDFEGRLHYKKILVNWPKENEGFKERWFKLKYNMLFYFRMNDKNQLLKEPVGVFILENSDVYYEENNEVPFSFSIVFKNDPEVKYLFSARSDDVVFSWISKLRNSTYGYLKTKLQGLQCRLMTEKLKTNKKELCQPYHNSEAAIGDFADFNSQIAQLGFNSQSEIYVNSDKKPSGFKVVKTVTSKGSKEDERNLILL